MKIGNWYFSYESRVQFWTVRLFGGGYGTHTVLVLGPIAIAWPRR